MEDLLGQIRMSWSMNGLKLLLRLFSPYWKYLNYPD